MTDLSQLVASPRTDVLPGYILSPPRLADFGMAEDEFARRHLASAAGAAVGLTLDAKQILIHAATDDVAGGRFKFGTHFFDIHARAPTSMPFLLYLTLRHKNTDMTRQKAADLVTPENEVALSRAVLELFRVPIRSD